MALVQPPACVVTHPPLAPASGVGADVAACLTGAAEIGVDVAGPSLPVCPLVATMMSLFQSNLKFSQISYGRAIGANTNSAKSQTRRDGLLSSPRCRIRFSYTADHCHSLVVVQNIPDEPPKCTHLVASASSSGRQCVGRVSGFQRLSRGFCRLVALLPSLLPPGSLYPGLPQSSLPLFGTPRLSLLQELSTVAIRVHRGDSDLSVLPIGIYLLPVFLSLSFSTPLQ